MEQQLITVATFVTPVEADLVRNALAEEGIESYLEGEWTAGMLWHLSNAIGGVKLQVAAADVARAKAILTEIEPEGKLPADDEEAPPTEEEVSPTSRGDATAARAWRAAVIGLFVCPPFLQVYSLFVLTSLAWAGLPLSDRGKRSFYLALAIDVVVVAVACLFIRSVSGS